MLSPCFTSAPHFLFIAFFQILFKIDFQNTSEFSHFSPPPLPPPHPDHSPPSSGYGSGLLTHLSASLLPPTSHLPPTICSLSSSQSEPLNMDALSYHASAQKPVSQFLISHSESRECHGAQGDPRGPLHQLPSHYTGLTSDHHPHSVYSRHTCPCAVPLTCQGPSSLSRGELFSPWQCTQLTHLPLPCPCSRITFSVR